MNKRAEPADVVYTAKNCLPHIVWLMAERRTTTDHDNKFTWAFQNGLVYIHPCDDMPGHVRVSLTPAGEVAWSLVKKEHLK
jgi:hypothetical protein